LMTQNIFTYIISYVQMTSNPSQEQKARVRIPLRYKVFRESMLII
jgi:hypothetical protein